MDQPLRDSALEYHRYPVPGKISITPTKAMVNQRDLALAYSPGVAAPCLEIHKDPTTAALYTARGNLVAVVTNGTAVLGLGSIGALASKPVMEGKACLFKKFAGIDVFDIEIDERDPDKLVDIIASLEPTFGGINLEDIKAPECFYIERKLRERMKIPVFHDDQHGTAIVVAAAVLNWLRHVGRTIDSVKLVGSGAGAAALACVDLLVSLGLPVANVHLSDADGVVYKGRTVAMDAKKEIYAKDTSARTLGEIITGADIFLGLSAGGVLKPEMLARMAPAPLVLAMANPTPEIMPEEAKAVRPDAIICTGRSDYPNQVNNVLCFPFIFRGALDVGATAITEAMKIAAVHALADLVHAEAPDLASYGAEDMRFGAEYLIPKPFDPRLIRRISPAVAQAAMASGVATRPISDMEAYRQRLAGFVYRSGSVMEPVFAEARKTVRRVLYAEGEEDRVLRAAQVAVDEGLARPLLVGRPEVIATRLARAGLRLRPGEDCEIINVLDDVRYRACWEGYYELMKRRGISRALAKEDMRIRPTLIGAMLLRHGDTDAMLCGTTGTYTSHLTYVRQVIGLAEGATTMAAMQMLILPGRRQLFICDTHVNHDPTAEQIAEITLLAAAGVRRFGLVPSVALLSHSNFGSSPAPSAQKMRDALPLIRKRDPTLAVEGEMRGDAALSQPILRNIFPDAALTAEANLLIMPGVDAANIAFNLLRIGAGDGVTVGGILLGAAMPVHILTTSATVRRLVNMTALAAVGASHRWPSAGNHP